ncbi:MAG: SUMF1/EgtB/PvdO family nonheme iron enzyme, partial [bacterium]
MLDLRSDDAPETDPVTLAVDDHGRHAVERHDPVALEAALRWAVKAGRALVLLDGFDEVRPESVERVRQRIAAIERASQQATVVVTSRRFGYVPPNDAFGELELLPLAPEHQRTLLRHWGLPDARIAALMDQIAGRPAMQDMAGNPFVLTLMALLAREGDDPLPTRRVALYRAVLGLLVRGRLGPTPAASRTGWTPQRLREALAELALALLQDHAGPWTAAELDHHLARLPATASLLDAVDDAPLALEADTGLLVAMDRRLDRRTTGWRFLHRSLMECLAAEALHRRGEAAARRFAVQLAGGRWYAPWTWGRQEQIGRWAEVYCHLAAMMPDPRGFLAAVGRDHPRLAMRALMSLEFPVADLIGDDIDLRRVDLPLVRLLIDGVPERAALGRLLVQLARTHRDDAEGLQLIAAGLIAIGQEGCLPAVAELAGGWQAIGVPGAAWVDVPAGAFVMGSPADEPGRFYYEGPQRRVELTRGLRLGAAPVMQALYAVVTGAQPSHFVGTWRHPVEQVSWLDAVAFCNGLSRLTGRSPA